MKWKIPVVILMASASVIAPAVAQTHAENLAACNGTNWDAAITGCTSLIESEKNPPENLVKIYYNRGGAYTRKGQYDKAIADYDTAIRLKPDYAIAHIMRGVVYSAKGQDDNALADFSEAIHLNPDIADAYMNRGSIYDNKGQYDKAIADYDSALRLQPDDDEIYINRGSSYGKEGKHDKAIADFDEAIRLKPDSGKA